MAEYSQTYWNELIDKYRNGSISEHDRYQLEKQALDDPFLFDALEGFSLYEEAKVETKEEPLSTRIFTLPRIAAAASIVLLVAVMINLKINSNSNALPESDTSIAMVLEDDANENLPTDEIKSDANADIENEASTTAKGTSETEQELTNISAKPSRAFENKKESTKIDEGVRENLPSATNQIREIPNKDTEIVSSEVKRENVIIENMKKEEYANHFEGNVVDVAPVKQESEKIMDSANASNFESNSRNEDLNEGAITFDSTLGIDQAKRKKNKAEVPIFYEAVPVIGKEIFDDYAKEQINDRGLRQKTPQEVTIEFTIDINGNLTNFHHIFSGCSECAPFAISILQKSGVWKTIPPGYSGKARYTFIF